MMDYSAGYFQLHICMYCLVKDCTVGYTVCVVLRLLSIGLFPHGKEDAKYKFGPELYTELTYTCANYSITNDAFKSFLKLLIFSTDMTVGTTEWATTIEWNRN